MYTSQRIDMTRASSTSSHIDMAGIVFAQTRKTYDSINALLPTGLPVLSGLVVGGFPALALTGCAGRGQDCPRSQIIFNAAARRKPVLPHTEVTISTSPICARSVLRGFAAGDTVQLFRSDPFTRKIDRPRDSLRTILRRAKWSDYGFQVRSRAAGGPDRPRVLAALASQIRYLDVSCAYYWRVTRGTAVRRR